MTQAEIVSVKYHTRARPEAERESRRVILGGYAVKFSDGTTVLWSHKGRPGTVSAWPLDPDNPEQRAILEETARRLHDAG